MDSAGHVSASVRARSALHDVRRVIQTPRAFSNWPVVLSDLARQRVGRGPAELIFRTRSGLTITCPNRPGARVPVYEIFAEDAYRLAWFLGHLMARPIQVIDVGAHVGTFACHLAHVHPQAKIQAYEPSPVTARYLGRNVAINGFADRVSTHECALARSAGVAMLADNGAASGLNGLLSAGHVAGSAHTAVTSVTFDSVVESAGSVDVVKIDCEGGEYDLVYGSSPGSWTDVQRVVLEYHKVPGQTWSELSRWFATVGLDVVRHEPITASVGTAWLSREPLSVPAD